ncbi:MAG: retroviral-like aspartic protease family protein [Deltaproteobacteria bacterium]|nr:retroviral-like aspartic protease family protein [Deltaproteobacteria bacterium]
MMSKFSFVPGSPTIVFQATVSARQTARALLALDTGATFCQISNGVANFIGLDLSSPIRQIELVTGSDVVYAPVVHLPQLDIFGRTVRQLEVVVRNLPPRARLDGVLGLNFFLDYNLFINYGKGVLVIQDRIPKSPWHRFLQAVELWRAMK